MKESIYDFTRDELVSWLNGQGKSVFRAHQVWQYLYRNRIADFSEMKELKDECVQLLRRSFEIGTVYTHTVQESSDGTVKFLFSLKDGHLIETVLMRHPFGNSVCVTTQVGCNIGCSFCASSLNSKVRDLSSGEIVQQVLNVMDYLRDGEKGETVTNVVVMGIGEPFDNFENLIKALDILIDQKGLSIPGRSITVSTSGLAKKICDFADINIPVNLAISLHAPNDELRSRIMKVNKSIPIYELMMSIEYYIQKTNRRLAIEYIMLKDVNDGVSEAQQLSDLLKRFKRKVYVNLIPYNPIDEFSKYERSDDGTIRRFFDVLMKNRVYCKIRHERGADIDAACGQLRNKEMR